jgi:23S rRNA (cytidine1920-2'-O)/16S rRNA (cytidine1409-2'-O)-methyltransferase
MTRADVFLVEQGHAKSRAEAQAAIAAGLVRINGVVLDKASRDVPAGADIEYEKPHPYVSRGGVKLAAALDRFALSPEGLTCVDLGASTGGFSQVLLQRGARKVFAIDVGHGQLHPEIAADPRVVPLEKTNARDLSLTHVGAPVDAIVCDVSFISLKLALPPALALAGARAWAVVLVKPQFEVGRDGIGKGGVVKDPALAEAALADMMAWWRTMPGWSVIGSMESPISGGEGNREFLLAARRT